MHVASLIAVIMNVFGTCLPLVPLRSSAVVKIGSFTYVIVLMNLPVTRMVLMNYKLFERRPFEYRASFTVL